MRQVLIKSGQAHIEEVPSPFVSPGNVLVDVLFSCISAGTEMASVQNSAMPLYRRALKQPENVQRVLNMIRDEGLSRTMRRVQGKLAAGSPTGYSAMGVVREIGSEVEGFRPGDMVACAGAGIANHAEMISVPVNLVVKVPEGVEPAHAATVTLGAIAMQGVRRANPTLGETFVMVGLGLLGLLGMQMLIANGCRVIGVDPDAGRRALAEEMGAAATLDPREEDYPAKVRGLTDGFGADGIVITAAGSSDEIVSQAFKACRRKGRVVLVGDVGLDLKRSDFYAYEIDFLISCSYGPGRYDPVYEEGGRDYPLPYVRWTENRNMGAYLDLIAAGKLKVEPVIGAIYPLAQAGDAYAALGGAERPLAVILKYEAADTARAPIRRVQLRGASSSDGKIRVGLVGASSFAQGVHLPNMVKLAADFQLQGVMSRTGTNAKAVATQYEAQYATTDIEEILNDKNVDVVLIATRHDTHGAFVLKALEAGKHVFVEKPLAVNRNELDAIEAFYRSGERKQVLLTGFNRRFSPAAVRLKAALKKRNSPIIANYRMNAGFVPPDSWLHGAEGAGRNIGEACHIYDLFNFLTDAEVTDVSATSISPASRNWQRNDNFVATIRYGDGSVCSLTYTALGSKAFPKEQLTVYCDGAVAELDDYKAVRFFGSGGKEWTGTVDKGQFAELKALGDCLRRGAAWPIPLEQQFSATRVSFDVEAQITDRPAG